MNAKTHDGNQLVLNNNKYSTYLLTRAMGAERKPAQIDATGVCA